MHKGMQACLALSVSLAAGQALAGGLDLGLHHGADPYDAVGPGNGLGGSQLGASARVGISL